MQKLNEINLKTGIKNNFMVINFQLQHIHLYLYY